MTGCSQQKVVIETQASGETRFSRTISQLQVQDFEPNFTELSDPELLRYVEDSVYKDLVNELNSDSYFVENVTAVYMSKEYLEEVAYNSLANIYFGFNLADLQAQFKGTKYIFTLGDDGQTTVKEFENYDETYNNVVKNVATGAGVILLCVTVSAVTGIIGAPAVSIIFAASAKTGTAFALSGGLFSGVTAGVVKGIQTKDFDQTMKSAASAASEGFKWGAISGAVAGGASKATALFGATRNGLTMNQVAQIQKESKYPLDVIKEFRTMEQYEVMKKAGLTSKMIDGKTALVRNIDLKQIDEFGRSNLERMQKGVAALDPTGKSYELHHIIQQQDSTLAVLTYAEHMQGGNNTILHVLGQASEVDHSTIWMNQTKEFWRQLSGILSAGGL